MSVTVLTKNYTEPPICQKEILRYAGCKSADAETLALLDSVIKEARNELCYRVCYTELSVTVADGVCDFGVMQTESFDLAKALAKSERVIVFAATLGVGLDRLIAKYGRISPARALLLQAFGTERVEALCDLFCEEYSGLHNVALAPRFSAGYGDLPLSFQREIFSLLDCPKKIGLTLTDSILMSPSKSVTAIVGIHSGEPTEKTHKCSLCDKADCEFRGEL